MPSGMTFTDISSDTLFGEKKSKGCYLTPIKGVAIVLGAVALATIVGLIVYFEHPDKDKKCPVEATTTSTPIPETTTPDDGMLTDIRLPTDLVPYHYDLKLRPNFYGLEEKYFSFNGSVKISFTVSSDRTPKTITLHKKKDELLKVADDSLHLECLTCSHDVTEFDTEQDVAREFFKVTLGDGNSLQSGQNYSIYMTFQGVLLKDLHGWYFSSYLQNDGTPSYLVTTQLQATDARKVFPCFDEPALKAIFTTTIERPKDLSSWSNTIIDRKENMNDDWVADFYEPTVKMSTYLLAFVVADFVCKNASDTSSGTWVQVCARPNAIDQAAFALEIVTPIQEYFEEYHNYTYPLPRTIHMAVPDFAAGAMENWGLILYRETALLYEPNITSSAYKQRVAVVVSHELAHMWFGNLVTPTWWDDIWLNEGFASFMEYLGVSSQFGDTSQDNWKMEDQFLNDDIHRVFPLDSLASSHPIYARVDNPDQISELFDTITYSKGASVIRMMNYFLDNDTFKLGVADYFKDKAFAAANHTDLFDTLTKKALDLGGDSDMDVADIMNTWILQLGYPVVHCSLDSPNGEKVTVSQEHFLLDSSQAEQLPTSPYDYEWQVPINFAMSNYSESDAQWTTPETYWLKSSSDVIDTTSRSLDTSGWFIANVRQRFYYRVNYDEDNWDRIVEELGRAHTNIHTKNRAQIIDDLFNLGRAGYIDQTKALDALRYMKEEEEYVPWTAVYRNIDYLYQMLAFSAGATPLQNFMQDIVEKQYYNFGWDAWGDNDHTSLRTRALLLSLACRFGLTNCVDTASQQYESWSNSSTTNSIHPDLRLLTYCSAIAAGTSEQWDFALEQYNISNSGSERTTLLRAMACSKETRVLSRYLQMAVDETAIRRQDFSTVINNVAINPYGRTLAWNFFRHNWDVIFQRFGSSSFTLTNIITSVTEHFTTEFQLAELESFTNGTTDMGSGERAFQQAADRIRANIGWLQTNEQKLLTWLQGYQGA